MCGMKAIHILIVSGVLLIGGEVVTAGTAPGWLVQLGIEPNENKLTTQLYDEVVQPADLKKGVGHFVFETDRRGREHAAKLGKSPNSIANYAGTWMEYSLIAALLERGKKPVYWQAEFKGIPKNFYDVVIFTKEYGPVVLSPKTSLRERYKQADLEALALRGLFPAARFYLLSLDPNKKQIENVQRKIAGGEVRGIRALSDETNMDELFIELDALTVVDPEPGVLRSARRIPAKPR
ncbi:MAG: hypothetical protein PCFJNLEI_02319 [Verrucomicrobiae bacterium]|nr:hypothetical protein [Verrucomicrobiae bacterium]